jgi:hypothetical protein
MKNRKFLYFREMGNDSAPLVKYSDPETAFASFDLTGGFFSFG